MLIRSMGSVFKIIKYFLFPVLKHEWTTGQTKRLIELIGEKLDSLISAKNKQRIWKDIADEFSESTIIGPKCEDKWKNLKKGYRDYVQKTNKSGTGPSKFEFAEAMYTIMGDDPSVVPRMTIDSDATIKGVASANTDFIYNEDDDDPAIDDGSDKEEKTPTRKRKRKSAVEEIVDYMKERNEQLLKEMRKMHTDNFTVMNKIADKL